MLVWSSLAAAALLWAVAIFFVATAYRRNGRILLREKIDQHVRELYDTPEGILKRMDEAPNDPVPAIKHVLLAEEAEDWPEMSLRAEAVRRRFPKLLHGHLLNMRSAWRQGDLARSRRLMAPIYRRFAEDGEVQELVIQQARMAKDWKLTVVLCRRMRTAAPHRLNGYRFGAEALAKLGRYEAAAQVLQRADKEFPEHAEVATLWDELEAAQAG